MEGVEAVSISKLVYAEQTTGKKPTQNVVVKLNFT